MKTEPDTTSRMHNNTDKKRRYNISKISNKKILTGLSAFILSILIIILVIIPAVTGSLHFLTVLTGSMRPSIQPGDIIISSSIDPEDIRVNDVITFQDHDISQRQSITHRVINITREKDMIFFQTKGDANEEPDLQLVNQDQIIGKVIVTIPLLGYVVNFAQSLLGFIILIAIPAIILIVTEIRNIFKISKEKPYDEDEKS